MKNWLKILLVIASFALMSVGIYFVLKINGITDFDTLKYLILKNSKFSILIYLLILSIMLTFLCFVPLLNTGLVFLGLSIFGPIPTFFTCLCSNFISSSLLFFIGDKFGEKFATKLIGKDGLEKAQDVVDSKSKILLPIMYLVPGFPDEALSLVAGMTKMKYWYLILTSMVYHSIEFGLFCFLGSGIIDWSSLSIIDWFVLINTIFVDIYLLLKLEKFAKNKAKVRKNDENN